MSKPATTIDLAAFKKQLADSLERSAKSAAQTIVKETLTSEISPSSQVMTAVLRRDDLPTEKEFTTGFDLLFAYVSIDGQRALPAGFYRIRVAFPGYEKKGNVKVSFIDAKGNSVHSLVGTGRPQSRKPSTDDNSITAFRYERYFCGNKKCLHIKRNGFGDWEWGCTDTSGNTINCVDRQP